MKKFIFLALILTFMSALFAQAQNAFLRFPDKVSLKFQSDKVGIGTDARSEKLAVTSVGGESTLGLYGNAGYYNPYISLFNSNKVSIWNLFANNDWWTIGTSSDTTVALICAKPAKSWVKFNGAISTTKVVTPSVVATKVENTDSTGIILYNRAGTKYRIYIGSGGGVKVATVP